VNKRCSHDDSQTASCEANKCRRIRQTIVQCAPAFAFIRGSIRRHRDFLGVGWYTSHRFVKDIRVRPTAADEHECLPGRSSAFVVFGFPSTFGFRRSSFRMEILPVLDLLNGLVVRGVGGKRNEYRPIESRLVRCPDVLSVAQAFRDKLGLTRLYVADLDAILYGRPNRGTCRSLAEKGFDLLVDAGLRTVEAARTVLADGAEHVIAGLETWPGPDELAYLCRDVEPDRVIFSLDLQQGRPLGNLAPWRTEDPLKIAVRAAEAGVTAMIVLDLAQVGVGSGVTTGSLCRQLRERFSELRLITGGGVRQKEDLTELSALGIDGVLVASALHNGRVTREDVQHFMPSASTDC
jgi:phosphoribosylformimino-5-aminoimidazole carboxamide ribotide isomerase